MRWRWRPVVFVVLSVLVLLVTATGGAAGEPVSAERSVTTVENVTADGQSTRDRTLQLGKELALTPTRPGEISVTLTYETPSNLAGLQVQIPDDPTVTARNGFAERDGKYVWDERTSRPTLTYRLSVNETRDASGPNAADGDYTFVDTGPWALTRTPQVGTNWSWTGGGDVSLSKSTTVDGSGAVGDRIAYLGAYQEHERRAHGQRFRLVVPASADMAETPDDIFASVSEASAVLRVGDRDSTVFMVSAPTTTVNWAVNGLQTGDADLWTRDQSRLDSADSVWVHEYVHTRQDYEPAPETRWFTEASATYYAALFALEQDRIGFRSFQTRLAIGERRSEADAILSDPSTWHSATPYTKGALVAGELDRQTRLADTGNSLQSVLRQLNAHDGPVSQAAFREMVRSAGGSTVSTLAAEYTTTTGGPSMWGSNDHQEAFDIRLANISYGFETPTNTSAFRVAGPYREGTLGSSRPIRLATGETLTVAIIVSNTGAAAGEYSQHVRVNGGEITRIDGTLAANATTRVPVTHTFTAPGDYSLSVGGRQVRVVVSEPAAATVDGLTADSTAITVGETVTLTATVRNDDPIPARGNLTLTQNGDPVETRQVVLTPGDRRDIEFNRTLDESGTYRFEADGQTVSVTVRQPSTSTGTQTDANRSTSSGDGPGFGFGSAVVALGLAVVVASRRS